jgi:hypothetical protein
MKDAIPQIAVAMALNLIVSVLCCANVWAVPLRYWAQSYFERVHSALLAAGFWTQFSGGTQKLYIGDG